MGARAEPGEGLGAAVVPLTVATSSIPPMVTRLAKIALVATIGVFLLIVVFNNLTDYGSNYAFVLHVLAMDTTFPGNGELWRAINSVPVYHAFYASIILWEAIACGLTFAGAWKLYRHRRASAAAFNRAKNLAIAGLTLNMLQWLVAFTTVGGEWFLMWQSKSWNGQEAAGRMFIIVGITLLFLNAPDDELSSSP
jgi:predicted small integral membrane protein